jgi:cytoskeleton protein RodZ
LVSAATQQFGLDLRKNRELKEVSREELAASTKVSLRQIEALELGRFENLPALVFARGFVRAIAVTLGLEAETLVAEFSRVHRDWTTEQTQPALTLASVSGTMPRLSRPRRNVSTDTTVRGLAIAAALAVATGGAALLKSRSGGAPPTPPVSSAPARERAEAGPASLGIPPAIARATVALPPEAPRADAETPAAVPAVRPAASAPAEPAPAGGVTLTLSFQEDCWTELYADGKKVAVETFRKGTTREFSGFQKYTITLGNAGGVTITVNGRPVPPLGQLGDVVRNVVIDESRVSG